MLVLSVPRGESVKVILEDGREIIVSIVDVRTDKARVGLDAAKSIQFVRSNAKLKTKKGE